MNYLLVGSNSAIASEVIGKLKEDGHDLWTVSRLEMNVTEHHQVLDIVTASIPENFLPDTLHGLIYFPGTIILKPFHRISIEEFTSDYQINFLGAVKSIQTALPALKKGNGSVVLISTVAATIGLGFHASIASSKAALEGLSRSLAAEYAPTIRFNVVAPSITDTPLAEKLLNTEEKKLNSGKRHPLGRVGEAGDIASSILFLLGNKSTWITGQTFHVDGGMSTVKVL
ncbi:SDR family NAD(P)-dependent oxidoreductase [Cytophaga aurantiaca]|uniref:SDR family NAD(P)-dependent oxidoreductase n=1 Tax=Cytophaga aurantiaca TaxID=29530 RepID=UPI0003636916|nr:SDR family oxidoreductase [Cytophaga aurantiaca]